MQRKSSGEMQDHPLVDQGWKDMEAMLDRELPVRNRRRRFFWPLLLLGGLTLGIVGWQAYAMGLSVFSTPALSNETMEEKSTGNQAEQPSIPIKESETSTKEVPARSNVDQQGAPGQLNSDVNQKARRQDRASLDHDQPTPERSQLQVQQEHLLQDAKQSLAKRTIAHGQELTIGEKTRGENLSVIGKVDPKLEEIQGFATTTEANVVKDTDISVPGDDVRSNRLLAQTGLLPRRTIGLQAPSYLLASQIGGAPVVSDGKIVVEQSRFAFAVTMGAVSDLRFTTASWDAGVALGYTLANKWQIAINPSYWRINSRRDFFYDTQSRASGVNIVLSVDPDEAFEAQDVATQQGTPAVSSVVTEVSTDVLHYLKIPIYLEYNPQGKWRPSLGISTYFLVAEGGAVTESNALSNNFRVDNPSVDLVKKTNYSLDFRLGYQLSNHLELNISYAHALRSHLNYEVDQSRFSNLHRYLRMGLAYGF